jgi:hypothetical protein
MDGRPFGHQRERSPRERPGDQLAGEVESTRPRLHSERGSAAAAVAQISIDGTITSHSTPFAQYPVRSIR